MNDWKNVDKLFTSNIIGIRDSNQRIITPQYLEEENPEEFEITVIGRGSINNFMGNQTPQIMISDYNIRDSIFDF